MKTITSTLLASALLATPLCTVGASQPSTEITTLFQSEIDEKAEKALKLFNVPGAAIGIIVEDQILLSQGYGLRDIAAKLPVDDHTTFRIASLTKAFTAHLLGQLVDEKKISWDDPVKKHLPDFRLQNTDVSDRLTIRDLIAHRTGVERHDIIWFADDITTDRILSILSGLPSDSAARQSLHYNNFMYIVAGLIIEKVTGDSFESNLDKRILQPLKMENSTASNRKILENTNRSQLYAADEDKIISIDFQDKTTLNAAGGLQSNIVDLLKWLAFNLRFKELNTPLITDATFREIFSPQIAIQRPPANPFSLDDLITDSYGLGWFLGDYKGHMAHFHTGHFDGCSTNLCLIPEKGIGIILLTNNSNGGQFFNTAMRNTILDHLLGEEARDWLSDNFKGKQAADSLIRNANENFKKLTNSSIEPEILQQYSGFYHHPAYGTIQITAQGEDLHLLYGKISFPIALQEGDNFLGSCLALSYYGVPPTIPLTFIRDNEKVVGVAVAFEAFQKAQPILFQREGSAIN